MADLREQLQQTLGSAYTLERELGGGGMEFSRAYAALAEAYVILPDYSDTEPRPSYRSARLNAAKAIALDSTLGSPHATIGMLFDKEHRWVEAQREFSKAIELEPNYPTTHHWYSRMLMNVGKFRESLSEAQRARSLDPLSLIINQNLGMFQFYARDYNGADTTLRFAVTLDPGNAGNHELLGQALAAKGQYGQGISELDTAVARVEDKLMKAFLMTEREYVVVKSGDTANTRNVLDAAKRVHRPEFVGANIAMLHLALSEPDSAVSWVRRYVSDYGDFFLVRSPFFDPLKNDARFVSLVQHPPQLEQ